MTSSSATSDPAPATAPRTRARAPKGHGDRLREEILEATEALLIETGSSEAVSIRGVADRVGVTPPSIYRHFEDKVDLLVEVCRLEFARMYEAIAEGAIEGDPIAEVLRQGRAYVHFAIGHPEHYRIMLLSRLPMARDAFAEQFFGDDSPFVLFQRAVKEMLELDAVRPEVKAMGDFELSLLLWASVHGLSSLMVAKPHLPWPDIDLLVTRQLDLAAFGLFGPATEPVAKA
jgi:AcrR family transcriptional regulator